MFTVVANCARSARKITNINSEVGRLALKESIRTITHLSKGDKRNNGRISAPYQTREVSEIVLTMTVLYFGWEVSVLQDNLNVHKRESRKVQNQLQRTVTDLTNTQELLKAEVAVLYKLLGVDIQKIEKQVEEKILAEQKEKEEKDV